MGRIEDLDFHWLVGILEGEGTFVAGPPSRPHSPCIRVEMTDKDVMIRIGMLLARAVIAVGRRSVRHRIPYAVSIRGVEAVRLMALVRDDLSPQRRAQIERALADWEAGPTQWSYAGMICGIPGCDQVARSRGLCKGHFDRWYKAQRRGVIVAAAPRPLTVSHFMSERVRHEATRDCDTAWLAGLLEGEGTFGATTGHGHTYPAISVEMTSRDVVDRAARILAAPSVTAVEPDNAGWTVTYRAAIAGAAAVTWMQRLRPLMGARRGAAIDDALDRYYPIRLTELPKRCVVPGCDDVPRARGLCHKHYMSWSRDVRRGRAPRVKPLRSN